MFLIAIHSLMREIDNPIYLLMFILIYTDLKIFY